MRICITQNVITTISLVFINRPPEEIAAYVFAQYFFSLLVYAVKVADTVVHLGDLVLGREVTQAPVGGCRADNVRW